MINIPLIRKTIPLALAEDICGVQPIELPEVETVTHYEYDIHVCDERCQGYARIHSFIYGWYEEPRCPLDNGQPNIQLNRKITGNIFTTSCETLGALHVLCEIPNMTFCK